MWLLSINLSKPDPNLSKSLSSSLPPSLRWLFTDHQGPSSNISNYSSAHTVCHFPSSSELALPILWPLTSLLSTPNNPLCPLTAGVRAHNNSFRSPARTPWRLFSTFFQLPPLSPFYSAMSSPSSSSFPSVYGTKPHLTLSTTRNYKFSVSPSCPWNKLQAP